MSLEDQARAWLDNDYTGQMDAETMRFSPAEMVEAFKAGWAQRGFSRPSVQAPDPNEPGPYGIGSDHWPGLGKLVEEMAELGGELGKLIGSGGDRYHWTGDLAVRIRGEIADVLAALDFFQEANPVLGMEEHTTLGMSGRQFMVQRRHWKHELFRAWARNAPPEEWPEPEQFGLPSRDRQ